MEHVRIKNKRVTTSTIVNILYNNDKTKTFLKPTFYVFISVVVRSW